MDISFTVCGLCIFCVSVFVRLRISPPRIKLAASNFAQQFIGVQSVESHILGNFAAPEAQNRTNFRGPHAADSSDRDATFVEYRTVCGRRISMCGYTADPEDGRTCTCSCIACFCCFGFHFFSTKPRNWLEERLQNDLFCVVWDIKPQLSQNYWATEWHVEIFRKCGIRVAKNIIACTMS